MQTSIKGEDFEKKLIALNTSNTILPGKHPYVGCLGSKPHLRGYTCGLWTIFHTMTVNAPSKSNSQVSVLQAIHGYVKYFFGCSDCSNHFQEMYKKDDGKSINTKDGAVKWLWKAHNKVNLRIKGSLTEDPTHPKEQFPSSLSCPKCWKGNQFDENQVMDYLKVLYSKYNLSKKGLSTFKKHAPINRQEKVFQTLNHPPFSSSGSSLHQPWSFSKIDLNLCVLLYGSSTLLVIAIYIIVVIRRRSKKLKFMQIYKNA